MCSRHLNTFLGINSCLLEEKLIYLCVSHTKNVDAVAYLRYKVILVVIIARKQEFRSNDLCVHISVCLNYSITALTCFVMGSDP